MEGLAADEKATLVMVYTHDALLRGEVVTKQTARVSIWPRSPGVPNLIHMFKPSVMLFGGGQPKPYTYTDVFIPTVSLIGFHLAPPNTEPVDYDPGEKNRVLAPLTVMMGTFLIKGSIRISAATSVEVSLEVAYSGWLSIYDAEITNPFLPQMPPIQVPMMLVVPAKVSFGK
jgi:hypothetical protein